MNKNNLIDYVRGISEKIVEDMDVDIYDVEYVKESGLNYLRIYISKEEGVSLDDCSLVNNRISEELDKEDPIEDAYYLEVSSPGIDRAFRNDRDFESNIGKEVEAKLYSKLDGKKYYLGILVKFDEKTVTLEEGGKEVTIERSNITKINKSVEF
ncbi:ribosome maturation factor RimP [Dethiosulfatibacter aminovorans DSM 17477]|uniref:Ribosome maturation factor RimP n=1 Tax=Dethiosulfatibacter aminovorans DSM 17477 TaxID=1121476 RepID=A0A1M6DEF6_9FIRM|nr:ribosome maturation factor RimP [Dethiosulfatibacter aminovorans]SHI71431.1 ribosome maturation factor RimP [Dethiosulfatibacter aminovorans DSM 17477]